MKTRITNLNTSGPTLSGKDIDLGTEDGFIEAEIRRLGANTYYLENLGGKFSQDEIKTKIDKMSTKELMHYARKNIMDAIKDIHLIENPGIKELREENKLWDLLNKMHSLMIRYSPYADDAKKINYKPTKQPKMTNSKLTRMSRGL